MPLPVDGRYRLRWTNEEGDVCEVTYRVKGAKVQTPHGALPYDAVIGAFRRGLIGLECTGSGFVGVNESVTPPTGYVGTCDFLGP